MRFLKKRFGFSLVEMIIAVGLLGAVTIGAGVYISNSFKVSNKLANKVDVQNSVTALMNKIETVVKMADISVDGKVGEKTENGFIIYQPSESGRQELEFIHENKKVKLKIGEKTEATYEYIEDIQIEFLKKGGVKIEITGEESLYKLTGTYFTRNTMPIVSKGEKENLEVAYYTLKIQNNETVECEQSYSSGALVQLEVQVPEGKTWNGWYINDEFYTNDTSTTIAMNENKIAKAVWGNA